MNRKAWLGLCVLLWLAACRPESFPCVKEGTPYRVTVALDGVFARTKVSGVSAAQEDAVTGSRLYVCLSTTGEMVASYPSDSGEWSFWLPDETYDFCAVVNAPELASWYDTRDELFRAVTRLDTQAPGSFVMSGLLAGHLVHEDEKITVEVRRLVAKVTFALHTDFDAVVAFERFFVRSAYMTNVVAEADLSGRPLTEGAWYNRMGYAGDSLDGMLYAEIGREMARRDSLDAGETFYAGPNACAENRDKQRWSPRRTRLVVEAQMDSVVTYYPVTIPEVRPNTHYHVDIIIKYLGTEHPEDEPRDHCFAEVAIRVEPWLAGSVRECEI